MLDELSLNSAGQRVYILVRHCHGRSKGYAMTIGEFFLRPNVATEHGSGAEDDIRV